MHSHLVRHRLLVWFVMSLGCVLFAGTALRAQSAQSARSEKSVAPPPPVYYVLGVVKKPGQYTLKQAISVDEAVTAAGGLKDDVSSDVRITVERTVEGRKRRLSAKESGPVVDGDVIRVIPDVRKPPSANSYHIA